MPIRNLGPCACCQTRYAVGFRIMEIGGYLSGSSAGIGMFVEHEQSGDIVFRVEFSDGSFETYSNSVSGSVAYLTEPSWTTLSGTFNYNGTSYNWSMYWGWGTYGSASIYKPVDECNEWFSSATHWDGTTIFGDTFSNILWRF